MLKSADPRVLIILAPQHNQMESKMSKRTIWRFLKGNCLNLLGRIQNNATSQKFTK